MGRLGSRCQSSGGTCRGWGGGWWGGDGICLRPAFALICQSAWRRGVHPIGSPSCPRFQGPYPLTPPPASDSSCQPSSPWPTTRGTRASPSGRGGTRCPCGIPGERCRRWWPCRIDEPAFLCVCGGGGGGGGEYGRHERALGWPGVCVHMHSALAPAVPSPASPAHLLFKYPVGHKEPAIIQERPIRLSEHVGSREKPHIIIVL
jgi:hypothetical protein